MHACYNSDFRRFIFVTNDRGLNKYFFYSQADHQHSEEQIECWREAFDIFDKNKDGHISLRELDTVVRSMGLNPSMKDLRSFIKEVDQNSKGSFLNVILILLNNWGKGEGRFCTLSGITVSIFSYMYIYYLSYFL